MFFKKSDSAQYMVVFLGNPGQKYEDTRHNVGFMTAEILSRRLGLKINKLKFKGLYCKTELAGQSVVLLKPQTYMNLSGESVKPMADFFKIPAENIIVVYDDTSLPVGKLRIRKNGSAGGHNGIKSIISHLGTDKFPRIKVGVGSPAHPDFDLADWVLGSFTDGEAKTMVEAMDRAGRALETILSDGIDKAMNLFN